METTTILEEHLSSNIKIPHHLSVVEDSDWGTIYIITLEAKASESLKMWLEIQGKFKNIPVVVKWTKETDVSVNELVEYLLKILKAGGFKVKAVRGFNTVESVRENREE